MKKFIYLILCLMALANATAADNKPLEFIDFQIIKLDEGNIVKNLMSGEWPSASTDMKKKAALICVKVENMPRQELKNIVWETNSFVNPDYSRLESRNEIWLWMDPGKNLYLDAKYNGVTNRQAIKELKPKGIYTAVLRNNKTVTITVTAKPGGATVKLDDGVITATAPRDMEYISLENVNLGRHTIDISYNGRHMLTDTIEVNETNIRFPEGKEFYDLRPKKTILFRSDPDGADIIIDGKKVGTAPVTVTLPYGPHTIKAITDNPAVRDSVSEEVNELYPDEKIMKPLKKQKFEVVGYYGGNKVNALLYIKDETGRYKQEGNYGKQSYQLEYPIGKKYDMKMTYYGHSKERTIKIKPDMDPVQKFNIAAKSSFVWPWQKEHDPIIGGVSVGYVQKQYVTKGEDFILKENIWGDAGKSMHGMQVGFHFEPAFHWGLGLYSGLYYEIYLSTNDNMIDYATVNFIEHCLYMPVHALFRLPLSRKIHIAVHGGIGMDYAVYGKMWSGSEENYDYLEWDKFYGETGYPKQFNLSGEIAVDLRFGPVAITGTYSKGLINHKSYAEYGDLKTTQNKMSLAVAWVFGSRGY